MTNLQLLTQAWEFHPSVVIGTLLLWGVYLVAVRFRFDRYTAFFSTGLAIMLVALVSPLDPLSDDYLFSAHMLQHIMIDFIAPALFVLGLPASLVERWMHVPIINRAERVLGTPVLAWCLGIFTLWAWHLPALYDATLASEAVHIFEHLTFLVTGTILWWPVFTPLNRRRLHPVRGVVYLMLAALFNGILGIIFTVSDTPYYPAYAHPEDEIGALSLVRDTWGLDLLNDQKLGGAIMWVGGSLILFWAIMALVIRWYREPEREET